MRRLEIVAFAVVAIVVFALGVLLASVLERRQESAQLPRQFVEVSELEADPAKWGKNFPREYDGFLKTKTDYGRTKYGGSDPYSKLEQDPRLKRLFEGYSFAVEYNEDRGHAWTVEDVKKIKRNPTNGTCMTCKSGQVPGLMQSMGVAQFYAAPFKEIADQVHESISCVDCHDSKTMDLRISRPALIEAFDRQGKDVTNASRQEMRTLVCAQCHVEYYFKGDGKYLTFPWDNGLTVEQVEVYYDNLGFKDWTHPASKADVIKIQHPEYEVYTSGVHAVSGVACADCHMSYVSEGATKVTGHWIRSPLTNISESCGVCHRQSEKELKDRVESIQDKTAALMDRTEDALVAAIAAIEQASLNASADAKQLDEARKLHRRAQIRWDWVAAENSKGFHSPQETARVLGEATDFARQAELAAWKARGQ